jgi:glycosyltransferase involved in cell wall biosynthesis
LRETWGTTALYVPPDDHAALHSTLMRLVVDRNERERYGRAARRRALHFQPQRMAQAYLRAYVTLLQEETVCA